MKPSVRRARTTQGHLAPGWVLTRPAYGFRGAREITRHSSWRDAHRALYTQPGTAGSIERNTAGYVPGLRAGWGRVCRPRWIET